MRQTNMNIPAILVHKVNGKLYKLNGAIVAINESNETCSFKYKDHIEENIPINKIFINEGFIDKLKEYGKAVSSWVSKKIKGFVVAIDELGKTVKNSVFNTANLVIASEKGLMPEYVHMFPSATMALALGITVDDDAVLATSIENERAGIIAYWERVMREAGTTDKSIEESVKYVNEHYYTVNNLFSKALNEGAVWDLENPKGADYGMSLNTEELKAEIEDNILQQISGEAGQHADAPCPLIWGAPGIGKTTIVKQVLNDLRKNPYDKVSLNIQEVTLSGKSIEQWDIPIPMETMGIGKRGTNTPMCWLPVYPKVGNAEQLSAIDDWFNKSLFLTGSDGKDVDGNDFEGGVVFFDEYTRVQDDRVYNVIMNLINDHKFGDNYTVASKWAFICAANRATDDGGEEDDPRYAFQSAQNSRFVHYTYVPTKEEWLDWCREINPVTHESNLPKILINFLETASNGVWYAAVKFGSYNHVLPDKGNSIKDAKTAEQVGELLQNDAVKTSKLSYNSRTWANYIGPQYRNMLKRLFGNEKYQELIDQSIEIRVDSKGKSYKEYYGDILPEVLLAALEDIDEGRWQQWYNRHGGDKKFNPNHSYYSTDGTMSAVNKQRVIVDYLGQLIQKYTNDTEGVAMPSVAWKDYNSYTQEWTKDSYESVWLTSQLPEKYQADDNKTFSNKADYDNTQYSTWKQDQQICSIIVNTLIDMKNTYPGNFAEDVSDDIDNIMNAPDLTDLEVSSLAAKLNKEFAPLSKGKPVELMFSNKLMANKEALKNICKVLKYSEVAKRLANVACYLVKLQWQTQSANLTTQWLNYLGNNGVGKVLQTMDRSVYEKYFGTYIDLKSIALANDSNSTNSVGFKAIDAAARLILQNGINYNYNQTLRARRSRVDQTESRF